MALIVQQAELELGNTLQLMHETLQSVLLSTAPYSVDKRTAKDIDTAAVLLQQEQETLRQSVAESARRLDVQLSVLIASVERLCDVPVPDLNERLRQVNATHTALGDKMVQLYDQAAALSARLEEEVMEAPIPSL